MTPLPIDEVLPDLRRALRERDAAVLVAPPGAGKTTRVPLALLDEPWLDGRKLLVLEPRRIATRGAALHMAHLLGEQPGETVGYRMRLDTRVGPRTRIEVLSEGVLTRMLQADPSLEGVGAVLFDEFHERHLDADLALALCLHGRSLFRADDPLKLLVMSATLDAAAVAALLDAAPVVESAGRQFPVEVVHADASPANSPLAARVAATVRRALARHPDSSVLVFLPGQAEIRRTREQLETMLADAGSTDLDLFALHGQLDLDAQQRAIAPSPAGRRKVVLATNIAETSLTIDGIHVVVDCGLARVPQFDPGTGLTRLQDRRIARAAADQRAGRAGRLAPGTAYRLWTASEHQGLAAQAAPEVLSADLAPLALQLLHWGVQDPAELRWLDAPPQAAWAQALDLLQRLGALQQPAAGPQLTAHGKHLAGLPMHPRLGHLLLRGQAMGHGRTAALLAALLTDGQLHGEADLGRLLSLATGEAPLPRRLRGWRQRVTDLAQRFAQQARRAGTDPQPADLLPDQVTGLLVALAFPDRIARQRSGERWQLASGRGAVLPAAVGLGRAGWLAVAVTSGHGGRRDDVVRAAAELDPALFDGPLAEQVHTSRSATWDLAADRFVAEERDLVGALVLHRRPLPDPAAEIRTGAVAGHLREAGLERLPWTPALRQWQARVQLLHGLDPTRWPDLGDVALQAGLEDWLGPWLSSVGSSADLRRLDLTAALHAQLDWAQRQALEDLAPERLRVPSGARIRLDYGSQPPVLAVKLQEMFGCEDTPRVADGRVAVLVHLLSPAGRPLQVTQDLAGFWRSSYQDVRREMRGRYPKHPWPEDPLQAVATARTRHRQG